ncbi:hypothetical protein MNBD_GAMMA06-1002 [hydrothermal vent metagenome]|uniref:Uncharacterized protein n=1 Tax=hydrothermal vent metagenome TaxID=652676 RepID=A0A3B0X2Y4_9ZZZZ
MSLPKNELIPKKEFTQFISNGVFTKASIRKFLTSIGIAPGIIVGNLQHNKKLLRADCCNDLKQRFKWVD